VDVRKSIAANPKTNSQILFTLSHDEKAPVRVAVAANPNCPVSVLEPLSFGRVTVRKSVAANYQAPVQILERLVNDVEKAVRLAASNTLAALDDKDPHTGML